MTSPTLTLKMVLLGDAGSASAALGTLAKKAESLPASIASGLGKLGSMIGGEVGELVNRMSEGLNQIAEDAGNVGKKITIAGASLAGLGAAGTLIGSKDASSLAQLKTAITDTGGAYSDYSEEVEKTIKQQENFGNSASQTQNALATLTEATSDPAKALDNMGLAANLAAAKHESLTEAATQLAKILEGSGSKTLKQYGITTTDVTLATQQLADKLKGQASASVDSWGGRLEVLKTKISDQVALLGQRFGPALTVVGTGLTALGTVTEFVRARQVAAAAATAAATAATVAQIGADEAATVAATELDVALDANPISLIVIAIAALVAGLVLLVLHFREVSDFLNGPWGTALSAAVAVVAPFIGIPMLIMGHWQALLSFFGTLGGQISSATSGMWDGIKHAFEDVLNAIIGGWNKLQFQTPNVPGTSWGSQSIGVPRISPVHLAAGAIVTGPTSALIGEGGQPEMVLPLNRAKDMGFGGGTTVNVTVQGLVVGSERGIGEAIGRYVGTYLNQGGTITGGRNISP